MEAKKEIRQETLTGERALFQGKGLRIVDSVFMDGESPLKESRDIELYSSLFRWKYPLWYSKNIVAKDCTWFEMARAGVWYTDNITVENAVIEAPKNFRRCHGVTLKNVSFPNAAETMWNCENVRMEKVTATGDYFAMNSQDMELNDFTLTGNYSFDGAKNVVIRNARLLSKDAFWNTENVTVYDSFISGEYLGWNAKNLTLINCTIESLQGMCYIDNLVMKNCKLINTTLAFEYSTVDAEITGKIDSVMNPESGTIQADAIDELILERDKVDPGKTKIICGRKSDKCKTEVIAMKTWNKKIVLSVLLIVCMMMALVQNPVSKITAKADTQDALSVIAKLGSKKINKKTYTMKKGSDKKIGLSITPKNSKVKKNYRSSKKSIVSVTKTGQLKAKKQGTAKITITVTGKGRQKKTIWFKIKVVKKNNSNQKTEIPVTLTIDGKKFTAKFYDNKTARELIEKMPITLSMKELNGNEKYHYFNTDFSVNEKSQKQIHAGDIKMYGSDCLVAFYKTFSTSYSYTSIGYVEDATGFAKAVGKGNVKITFQKG